MLNKFQDIDALVEQAAEPLGDAWLDAYYAQYEEAVSTRLNYYRFLYLLVQKYQPAVCVELGVEFGLASAHMACAAAQYGGMVIGIDHNFHDAPVTTMSRYKNYHYLLRDTETAFPEVVELLKGLPVGLVFQDSSHHYDASRKEWSLYSSMMVTGSLWVCDDIIPAFHDPLVDPPGKGMVQYFWELPGYKKVYPDVLDFGNAVGVVII